MKQHKSIGLNDRARSVAYAINGLYQVLRTEPNAWLHSIATLAVVAAGIARDISPQKWLAILFAIALVWVTEAINTAIEKLCDFCCDNKFHPSIKIIKDISAAAVMIAAAISIVTGIIVFFF